jgi:F0F1-type ATP synthase assembly protein I
MIWWQLVIRAILSGALIVGASELAKKNCLLGALIASLPLVSIMAIIWLYNDSSDLEKISQFSKGVFWLVIPSLALFISLPIFIKRGVEFWPALGLACLMTIICYGVTMAVVKTFGSLSSV